MSTLRIIHKYARRFKSSSYTRLDCRSCREPIATGAKVILESQPDGSGSRPNAWHPECFAGLSRNEALARHWGFHGQWPPFLRPQLPEWDGWHGDWAGVEEETGK